MQKHEDWLKKANRDLRSAKALLGIDILDTSIYHTQQCAEKALKAYLTYQRDALRKTHDLEFLVKLCCGFDQNFDSILNEASELNPYCFRFRYPDDLFDPER